MHCPQPANCFAAIGRFRNRGLPAGCFGGRIHQLKRIFDGRFHVVLAEFFAAAAGLKQSSDPAFDDWNGGGSGVSEELSQAAGRHHFANQQLSLDFAERRYGEPRSSSLAVTICNQHLRSPVTSPLLAALFSRRCPLQCLLPTHQRVRMSTIRLQRLDGCAYGDSIPFYPDPARSSRGETVPAFPRHIIGSDL